MTNLYTCAICDIKCYSLVRYESHKKTKHHLLLCDDDGIPEEASKAAPKFCAICEFVSWGGLEDYTSVQAYTKRC